VLSAPAAEPAARDLRLLYAASFTSTFDRFSAPPLLLAVAASFGASLAEASAIASVYFLLYGGMQAIWGVLSDFLGRVRVIRLGLVGGAVAGIAAALAPNLGTLVATRAVGGGMFAAIIPTLLVYVGDTVAFERRQRTFADVIGANAAGTALATLGAGIAAAFLSWRLAFLAPALLAIVLAWAVRGVPEPNRRLTRGNPLASLGRAVRRPWALLVIALATVEGAVLWGLNTYLAPALESTGRSPAVAGVVVAAFGLATLGWTRLLKPLTTRVTAPWIIVLGMGLTCLGYTAAAWDQGVVGILVASVLVAACYALLHTSLQAWATEVAPDVRASVISLFATGLFAGGALGAALGAPLAAEGQFEGLFALGALAILPIGVVAALGRARFRSG
jgi:predicted MFS family arabinose efflux permease